MYLSIHRQNNYPHYAEVKRLQINFNLVFNTNGGILQASNGANTVNLNQLVSGDDNIIYRMVHVYATWINLYPNAIPDNLN